MILEFLAVILILLCILSGSVLLCSMGKCSFSDALPLTFIAVAFINYIFGLFGALQLGFILTMLCAAAAYCAAVYFIIKNRDIKKPAVGRDISPLIIFTALSLILLFLNYGKLLASWDEFSHWGDVVKMMTTLNVLSTSPASDSLFPEYPPAMALFQYFAEKLYMLITGSRMAEWLLYYSYQLFMFSLYFPLIKKLNLKKLSSYLYLAVLFLLPTVFQHEVYSKIYIDPFLSSAFAVLLGTIVLSQEHNTLYYIKVFSFLALLTITKTLGILLAVIAFIVFIIYEPQKKIDSFKLFGFLSVLIPALSWQINVKLSASKAAFNLAEIKSVSSEYSSAVLGRYFKLLTSNTYTSSEALCPQLPFILFFIIIIGALFLSLYLHGKERPICKKRNFTLFTILLLFDILFIIGLGFAYVYVFSSSEAETMTEASRYINNLLMADSLLSVFCFISLADAKNKFVIPAALLAAVLLFTPLQSTARFLLRREVLYSQTFRAPYDSVTEKLIEASASDLKDKNIIIATESTDAMDYMVFRTSLRPASVVMYYIPGDEDKLSDMLVSEEYDYLAVFEVNEPIAVESRYTDLLNNGDIYSLR